MPVAVIPHNISATITIIIVGRDILPCSEEPVDDGWAAHLGPDDRCIQPQVRRLGQQGADSNIRAEWTAPKCLEGRNPESAHTCKLVLCDIGIWQRIKNIGLVTGLGGHFATMVCNGRGCSATNPSATSPLKTTVLYTEVRDKGL